MKKQNIFNISNNEAMFEDTLYNKQKTLLNRKRKASRKISNKIYLDNDELFNEESDILFENPTPFNNTKSFKFEQTNNIFKNEEIDSINVNTNIPDKNFISSLNFSKINQEKENNNLETAMNTDYNFLTEKDISDINLLLNKSEEEKNNNSLLLNTKEIKNINNKGEIINENNIKLSSYNYENPIKLKGRSDLCCLALDLLKNNGEFQILFSDKLDSAYFLKIEEIEIKDNYDEQIKYAKYYGKRTNLYYTCPNKLFWEQRYYYFKKFDKGIKMDYESWYSVTPEEIAKYTAKLIKGKSIIDGFCGCGGNVIQFSRYCSKVYAIDIYKEKLDICKNNCKVYKCQNNIEFIESDFLKMKNKIKADYIFLSPPWGGTGYKKDEIYSIKKSMEPDITEIIRVSLNVADNILFFLPRNLDLLELFDICSIVKNEIKEDSGKNIFFDVQIIESNNRIKALLIIFGHHIKDYFSRHKLEKFVKQYYKDIDVENIDNLYSSIKTIGCYKFFREEYKYRTTLVRKSNDLELSGLNEYIKSSSN